MVIPQQTSPYAQVIYEINTSRNYAGWPLPEEGDVRRMRLDVRWGWLVGATIQSAR